MEQNPDRVEAFRREIAGMNIRTPQAEQERWALVGGIAAMVAGLLFIIAGWWGASGTTLIVDALAYVMSGGILGLALVIIGAALFVRYSTTRYLRFWLVRQIYEEQANTDRIVAATRDVQQSIDRSRMKKKAASPVSTPPTS